MRGGVRGSLRGRGRQHTDGAHLTDTDGADRAGHTASGAGTRAAEHLWPLADEAVANKHFATLKDLDAALSERCRTLADMPEVIKAATHFAWWPAVTPPSSPAH